MTRRAQPPSRGRSRQRGSSSEWSAPSSGTAWPIFTDPGPRPLAAARRCRVHEPRCASKRAAGLLRGQRADAAERPRPRIGAMRPSWRDRARRSARIVARMRDGGGTGGNCCARAAAAGNAVVVHPPRDQARATFAPLALRRRVPALVLAFFVAAGFDFAAASAFARTPPSRFVRGSSPRHAPRLASASAPCGLARIATVAVRPNSMSSSVILSISMSRRSRTSRARGRAVA